MLSFRVSQKPSYLHSTRRCAKVAWSPSTSRHRLHSTMTNRAGEALQGAAQAAMSICAGPPRCRRTSGFGTKTRGLFARVRLALIAAIQEIGMLLVGPGIDAVRNDQVVVIDCSGLRKSHVRRQRIARINQSVEVRHRAVA